MVPQVIGMKCGKAEFQERAKVARNQPNFWVKKQERQRAKEILKAEKKMKLKKEAEALRTQVEKFRKMGIKI